MTDRKELSHALNTLARGDTLIETRLDRLTRSTRDLLNVHDVIEVPAIADVAADHAGGRYARRKRHGVGTDQCCY